MNYQPEYTTQRKQVFKSAEIEHIWASQTVAEGRNPQGNVFFNGPSLYSYGRHFETARFISKDIVLITTRTYSNTTARHVWKARAAVNHKKVYYVASFDDPKQNAADYLKELTASLERINRMRTDPTDALRKYALLARQAADYVDLCKKQIGAELHKAVKAVYAKSDNPLSVEVLAKLTARRAAYKKAVREKEEKARQDAALRLVAWKDGHAVTTDNFHLLPVALRLIEVEGEDGKLHSIIETSHGASVPVIEARKLWTALQTDAGQVPGMQVGHYTVTRLDLGAGTLVVGCHVIPMRELARMAVTLGLESEGK